MGVEPTGFQLQPQVTAPTAVTGVSWASNKYLMKEKVSDQ